MAQDGRDDRTKAPSCHARAVIGRNISARQALWTDKGLV